MKPKTFPKICLWFLIALLLACSGLTGGAALFINLNFESGNFPDIPNGQFGTNEPVAKALPGWSAFIGVHPITEILHNNGTLGDPSVAIYGPTNFSGSVISGRLSLALFAGVNESTPPDDVGASISQTAVIPSGSLSILFKTTSASSTFGLFASGNSLSLVPVFATNLYTIYGADISPYANQNTELKSTVPFVPFPGNGMILDDISFSTNPIPEPSTVGLVALAGFLWLGFEHRRRAIPRC